MNSKFATLLAITALLSYSLSASAKDSVEIKEKVQTAPVEHQTTTTTTVPGDPVIISAPDGSAAVVAPSTSTTIETQTRQESPVVEKSVQIQKRKNGHHHLINFFGLKVL